MYKSAIAVVLAWLLPGAGHFYLGKKGRAVAFLCIVAFSLLFGLMLDGKVYTIEPGKSLTFFGKFACMGFGPVYFVLTMKVFGYLGAGNIESFTFDYGNLFVLTAGLMNILLIIDAFDIAKGRKK